MLGRRALVFLLVLMATAAFVFPQVRVQAAGNVVTPGQVILDPLPGTPAIGLPGDTIEVYPAEGVSVQSLQIVSILHGPYDLQIVGTEGGVVRAKIPNEAVPDVYFLVVRSNKGDVAIPNGLWVMDRAPTVLRIAHGSDLHVTSGFKMGFVCGDYFQKSIPEILNYCNNPIGMHSYTATESFMTYYAMVGSGGQNVINLIISTGDDVDTNGDQEGYKMLNRAILYATAAGTPLISIKGNHDDPPTYYGKYVGPRYFYRVIGDFLIIGLDSRGEERHPEMEQLQWMEDVLKSHPNKTVIVLVHHPFWYSTPDGKWGGTIKGYTAFDDSDWKALTRFVSWDWEGSKGEYEDIARYFLQMVEKYNIRLVLSGHIHNDKPVLYIDKNGNEHWFWTLTATGAPDKTSNPPSETDKGLGYTVPSWYGSQVVYVYSNGTVEFPLAGNVLHDGISSLPVPQKFVVFRQEGQEGTAVQFFNELNESVSGPLVIRIPAGASVDPEGTNITYRVVAEREIAGEKYMLLNVTVPRGVGQITAVTKKDTKPPEVSIGYITPSKPKPGQRFSVYISADDNVGIRTMKVQIIVDGKVVKELPAFSVKPSEVKATYFTEVDGVNATTFTIKAIATDFYGNTKEATYQVGTTTTITATTTTGTSSNEGKGICGPAAILALIALPNLLRGRK
ncbi:metallophosphoesterase [Thermococcus waiotapuensis]|uniref:Metallophosphoesterase n=1 Tax=Thermococcus waiotapuensis TaxID=90909 RepID=A0AAE4SYZ5_9EURY|nr:metallophosphoesterase [Thermococcus waiotapuensis]MDV3104259.1 metallophosphoesterase [Thermococcus waiotapuensis]